MERKKLYSVDELVHLSDGDIDFVKRMIDLFVIHGAETVEEMKAALEQNDYKSISLLAHRLKSTIKLLSITTLLEEIKLLETCQQNNLNPETIGILVHKVRSGVYNVIEEIKVDQKPHPY